MKRDGYSFLAILALVLAAGVLAFWPVPAAAQKVVVAQGIDPEALDCQASVNIPTMVVNSNIYDPLISRDHDLKIVNRLATDFKNTSPTKWRFELRKGVTFHNGEPFNAEAVKFSFERIYAAESKSPQKGWFNTIDRVEVVNDHAVDIVTKKPDPILPARLTLFFMVPPKYIKEVGNVKFNLSPVGTGPFKFVKWVRDDQVALERNEKYWDGAPGIKDLIFRAMPETQSRLAALQTGEIDIATNVPPDLAENLKGKESFAFKSTLSSRVLFLQLCTNKESPLLKQKVRQAINYAIDRDSIIKNILKGYGEKIPSLVPKLIFGYDPNLKPYPYDPQMAKKLLAEAGYPNGLEINMDGPSGRYMRDKEVCQAITGQLEQVGIKVNLKIIEWGTYISNVTSHKTNPIYLMGWSLPSLDPDQWLWVNTHTDEPFSQNSDPELDKMLEEARYEIDVTKREKLYHKINAYVHEQAYLAVLYEQRDLVGVSNRIEFTPRGDEMIFMRTVKLVK
jgi:peptide/nickel transport system substrate-binding protein